MGCADINKKIVKPNDLNRLACNHLMLCINTESFVGKMTFELDQNAKSENAEDYLLCRMPAKEKSSSLAKRTTEKAGPKVVASSQNGRAIRNFRQVMGPQRRKITALSEFKESSRGVCRHQ